MHHAAARAAAREAFVASALAEYQALNGLDQRDLAAWLGIDPAKLTRLALCLRPEGTGMQFRKGIRQIVAATGVDGDRLAALLREVEGVRALRGMPGGAAPGMLMAARDRADDAPPPPADESQPEEP
jgi:hypothetical protein